MATIDTKKHTDVERWVCIYPAYINRKKTLAEGRRIPKAKAVDNPTYKDIDDVLSTTGLKYHIENKLYPREISKEHFVRGRARVQLKNDDGSPVNPDFPTREAVMLHLGALIPKLKSRQGKQANSEQNQQKDLSGGGCGGKKKGKKGR
ncbi:hypothetical protein M8J77_001259 [Diaphorina citri]|nr:hypothetical protein M8J77_001259 [Diaphorina citri]